MKYRQLPLRKRLGLELERMYRRDIVKRHPLRQLFWECTLRCDLACRHCGSDCKMKSDSQDMPFDDFRKVLESIARETNPNDVFIMISGGEPLMRNDLEECGRKIHDMGFPWGIVTNGMHMTEGRFQAMVDAGLHSLALSIDGLCKNHNWMRGNDNSFKQVERTIGLLTGQDLVVWDVVTCATKRNFDELPLLRRWLIENGVNTWRLIDVFPQGRAASDPEMIISDRQYYQLLQFIRETERDYPQLSLNYGCEGFVGEFEFDVRPHSFFCQAGVTVGGIMADGSISACTSIRGSFSQGNIYKDDFMQVWEHGFDIFRNRKWMKTGPCAHCNMWRYCNGNGMHLRESDGTLMQCHLKRMVSGKQAK